MSDTHTRNPKSTLLVEAYLAGDPDAIEIIDVAVDVARTVAVLREAALYGGDDSYDDIRNDCDQATDSLLATFGRAERAGLVPPHVL